MQTLEAFQTVMATKMHMTGSYDIRKYGMSPRRFSAQMMNKRSDQWAFEKLAARMLYKRRLMLYTASVYVAYPKLWVGDLANVDQYHVHYQYLRRYISAPVQYLNDDCAVLVRQHGSIKDALTSTNADLPPIINSVIGGQIHTETAIMFDRMTRLFDQLDQQVGNCHPIWKSVGHRLKKYRPFVLLSSDAVIEQCKETVRNHK